MLVYGLFEQFFTHWQHILWEALEITFFLFFFILNIRGSNSICSEVSSVFLHSIYDVLQLICSQCRMLVLWCKL